MTHALVDPEITAQLPEVPPGDDPLPPGEPESVQADRPGPARVVAGLISAQLSGLCAAGRGELVQLVSTVTADTVVVVDMTRLSVTGEEASARIRLTLEPVSMSPPRAAAEPAEGDGGPR